MSKRRRNRKKRRKSGGPKPQTGAPAAKDGRAAVQTEAAPSPPPASRLPADADARRPGMDPGEPQKQPLVPWRTKVRSLLDGLRGFARQHHGAALDEVLRHEFGDPPKPAHPADLDRLTDDLICLPGSAGDGTSIADAYAAQATHLEAIDQEQVRRFTVERRRGVFLVQQCFSERIDAWDPLEGAGLTLHLLDRLPPGRAVEIRTGTVLTATYLPYVARLVATGLVEFFTEPEALRLFREQVTQSGATWHDAPPPAPRK